MSGTRFLRPEDMRRMSTYEFAPKALVEGYFSGRHRSLARGSSTEFRDYRAYAEGDDPSRIDWRVFARSDRYYVRNFHQETSTNCYLFLDRSASMGFGSPQSKLDYASFFTAALSYLVVRGKDRVALNLFDSEIREFHPLGSTGRHLNALLNALENNEPGGETSLARVLSTAAPLLKQRGSLIVISDFFDDVAATFEAFNSYLHRGFRIFLFHILDPVEMDLGDLGLVSFQDLETGSRVTAHARDIRSAYTEAFERHVRSVRALARRRQIHYELARTDRHYYNLFDVLVNRLR